MSNLELEARLLAAVQLHRQIEGGFVKLPGLAEIRFDEFEELIGRYHALVSHYEEALKRMMPED